MKKYITILVLFFSFSASAQYTPMNAFGYRMKYLKVDSGFALPYRDTTIGRGVDRPGLMVINTRDSLPYYYSGKLWKPVYVDSTGVIELINGKVDSVTVNGNNLFYWVAGLGYGAQLNKLDSIHVSADSIFTCIAGNCTFQYLTTAGTGTVTSIIAGFGLTGDTITTTGAIAVDTSVFHTSNWNNATYASIVHFHSASDIISGTLPIARGGTGLSGIGGTGQSLRVATSGSSLEYYTPPNTLSSFTNDVPFLKSADTTNKWIQDIYTHADSLFKQKNGEETFLLKAGISRSTVDSILGGYYSRGQVDSIVTQLRTEIPDVSGKVNYTDSGSVFVTPSQLKDSLSNHSGGGNGVNIYNTDSSLTGNRNVNLNTHKLSFTNGSVLIGTTTDDGHQLRVDGTIEFNIGSDAPGDIFYRDSLGTFSRLAAPTGFTKPVLGFGSGYPKWQEDSTGGGQSVVIQTVTSGSTITINNTTTWLVINPSSTLSSLTITLPASPTNGQLIDISFGGTITTANAAVVTSLLVVANTGQGLIGTGTYGQVVTEDHIAYRYNSSLSKWFRN